MPDRMRWRGRLRSPAAPRRRASTARPLSWRSLALLVATQCILGLARRVVIVGASRGIGLELATLHATRGTELHATYRTLEVPKPLVALAATHVGVRLHALDVRNRSQLDALAAGFDDSSIDLLIHNAGINQGSAEAQLAVNAEAPFAFVRAMLPKMLRSSFICIVTSDLGTPGQLRKYTPKGHRLHEYARSKLEANRRFRDLEPGWRAYGITAIAMQPGNVASDMNGGKGKITTAESARNISSVLGRLTPAMSGSFLDYQGRTLSWQTGKPTTRLPASKRTTGTLHHSSAGQRLAWLPIEGRTVQDIYKISPDPLGALSRGEVPAVILRGALSGDEVRSVLDRLLGKAQHQWIKSRKKPGAAVTYADLGANLAGHLDKGKSPAQYIRSVTRAMNTFARHGLLDPIAALHRALSSLASGRKVAVGVDVATNKSFSPGIFRQSMNGGSFTLHLDSLHADRFTARACGAQGRRAEMPPVLGPSAHEFQDLYRFKRQLAALLLLRRSENPGPELSAYDYPVDKLLGNCEVDIRPTAHNVHVANTSRIEEVRRLLTRESQLHIEAGDVYVINVNRLHMVHPILGTKSRVSLGTFLGCSESEVRIWS